MAELPGNSYRQKAETKENQRHAEKVIKGEVVVKKKTSAQRFAEEFMAEDFNNVKNYIVADVLMPAIKSTIADIISNACEMLLFGETRGRKSSNNGKASYTSYSSIYGNKQSSVRTVTSMKPAYDYDAIILTSRGEAEDVLDHLCDLIDTYGMARVADLYDLVGIPTKFTDNNWGWESLGEAHVQRVREGYLLKLPNPISLN